MIGSKVMTQNANEAKKSRSFAEQLVFSSSIHSSMIQTLIYVIAKFASYVVELLSKAEDWSVCGYPMRDIWRKDLL